VNNQCQCGINVEIENGYQAAWTKETSRRAELKKHVHYHSGDRVDISVRQWGAWTENNVGGKRK